MYQPKEPAPSPQEGPPGPGEVVAWLTDRGAVEQALHSALGGLPSERDVMLARMGDVLQASAQGLEPAAAAVWAGVPEAVLRGWIDHDPAFAAAVSAAHALAAAHGIKRAKQYTPAMLRAVLTAMSGGLTQRDSLKLIGFSDSRFRALVKSSPPLGALLGAVRRVRPAARARDAYVPVPHRPRRPGLKRPTRRGFRLIERASPEDGPPS